MNIPFWTSTGDIDLAALRPQDMTAEILGDTLAKINRYNGRTHEPWSVAAHSVLVETLCPPQLKPWALLHDAHEAFIGDIVTPAVDLIAAFGGLPDFDDALARTKSMVDSTIASAWHLPVLSLARSLRDADRIALCAEAILYVGAPVGAFVPSDREDIDRAITILLEMPSGNDWRAARDLWLARVAHHAATGGMTPPVAH